MNATINSEFETPTFTYSIYCIYILFIVMMYIMGMNCDAVSLLILCMHLLWSLSCVDGVMITANTNDSSIRVNTFTPTIVDTSTPKWRLHNQGGIYPWYVFKLLLIIFRTLFHVDCLLFYKGI